MKNLFTVYSNIKLLSVIMSSQMLLKRSDYQCNELRENILYLFLFKSPRNSPKIFHLAKQVSSYDNEFIVQSFSEATSNEFTYLLMIFIREHQKGFFLDLKYFQVMEL